MTDRYMIRDMVRAQIDSLSKNGFDGEDLAWGTALAVHSYAAEVAPQDLPNLQAIVLEGDTAVNRLKDLPQPPPAPPGPAFRIQYGSGIMEFADALGFSNWFRKLAASAKDSSMQAGTSNERRFLEGQAWAYTNAADFLAELQVVEKGG